MARPLRIEFENAFYHVMARGNERKDIFRSIGDRKHFVSLFSDVYLRYKGMVYVYTLMNNHYHILLETKEANLSRIMHHINVSYTVYYNKKYERSGHLFQGRYKALLIDKENYLLELSRYIHLNPVRAGIVEKPEDYRWSSYRYYTGQVQNLPEWLNIDWVVERFGKDRVSAFREYRKFIDEGLCKKIRNPFDNVFANTILGSNDFVERIKERIKGNFERDIEVPATKSLVVSYTIDDILDIVSNYFNIEVMEIKKRKRGFLPRKIAMYLARRLTDLSLRELADYFGTSYTAISKAIQRFEENETTKKEIEKIVKKLEMSNVKT